MKEFVIYFKNKWNKNTVKTTKAESLEQAQEKAERILKVNSDYVSIKNVFERRTDLD